MHTTRAADNATIAVLFIVEVARRIEHGESMTKPVVRALGTTLRNVDGSPAEGLVGATGPEEMSNAT